MTAAIFKPCEKNMVIYESFLYGIFFGSDVIWLMSFIDEIKEITRTMVRTMSSMCASPNKLMLMLKVKSLKK